jgi:hypothetical protein
MSDAIVKGLLDIGYRVVNVQDKPGKVYLKGSV